MDADAALIQAWRLGDDDEGWSDTVMQEAERLLPILVEAGYAERGEGTWAFTGKGAARALELEANGVKSRW